MSAQPSLSQAPTIEFPCVDDPNAVLTITRRRRSRSVKTCSIATKKRCKKGRYARQFRTACPYTCRVPRCTCIDLKKVTFKLNNRRFTKHCNKVKESLCAIPKVKYSCPTKCKVPRCADNNPQLLPLY